MIPKAFKIRSLHNAFLKLFHFIRPHISRKLSCYGNLLKLVSCSQFQAIYSPPALFIYYLFIFLWYNTVLTPRYFYGSYHFHLFEAILVQCDISSMSSCDSGLYYDYNISSCIGLNSHWCPFEILWFCFLIRHSAVSLVLVW